MRATRAGLFASVRPQVASMGRFRKKSMPTVGSTTTSKKVEDEKGKAEKNYTDQLLKSYQYVKPKDKRTDAEKAAFKEESKKWAKLWLEHDRVFNAHEQRRLDFMWEAIAAVPAGPLRDHAMTEDAAPPPEVMSSLVLADIGPIPESEAERLEPLTIDHTVLQRMTEAAPSAEEDAKMAAQMLEEEDEQERGPRKGDGKAAAKGAKGAKEAAKPAEKKAEEKKKPAAGKEEEKKAAPGKEDKKDDKKGDKKASATAAGGDKKPAKGKKD